MLNKYEIIGDDVICESTNKHEQFVFDAKYLPMVSKYSWHSATGTKSHSICAHINNTNISLSRFIYELENGPIDNGKVQFINDNNRDFHIDNLILIDNTNKYIFENDIAIGKSYNSDDYYIIDRNMYEYAKEYIFGVKTCFNGNKYIMARSCGKNYVLSRLILNWNGIDPENFKTYFINGNWLDHRFSNIGIIKNEYNVIGDIAYGHIANSDVVFMIDSQFIELVSRYKCINNSGYITIYSNRKKHKLHRFICESLGINIDNLEVHHINGNKYDNRLCNLFICDKYTHECIHTFNLTVVSNINLFINNKGNRPEIVNPFIYI